MRSLSNSQVETWEQCHYKWKLLKIDRVTQAPAAPLIAGDAIHQAIAADGLSYLAGGPRLDYAGLMAVFTCAIAERLSKDDPHGLISGDERDCMLDNADAILAGYVEHVQPHYRPLAVEEWFGKEPALSIPGAPGWGFQGIIDARINTHEGHGILDFKTGKRWDIGAEHGKAQASAYLWVHDTADFMMFLLLPVVDGICIPERRVTTRTAADLHAYADHLRTVAREIDEAKASGDFPAKTGPLCGWCGCLGSCETGQDWLRSKRRESHVPGVTL